MFANSLCSLPTEKIESTEELRKYEKGAVDRIARLFKSLLHLELSRQASSYTPRVFRDHVDSLQELIQIISNASQKQEG